MPNWKKVVVSGSRANLSHITASAGISTSGHVHAIKFGRDTHNLIDFTTDNQIRFRLSNGDEANMTNAYFYPHSNDGMGLGFGGKAWSDLHLAEGGVINWDNGDVTITQTGNTLAIAGTELVTVQGEIKTDDRVRGGEIITKPSGSDNHSVHIKGGLIFI